MDSKITVGFAVTGSYCTLSKILPAAEAMAAEAEIIPIFSDNSASTDTRFGKAEKFISEMERISGRRAILSIAEAEPIGPKGLLDVLVIAPCTGNTVAKLANGIADTTAKSQLRNNRPIVIGISTNDGLGANAVNIGKLLARKNIYMVPFGQDDCINKENSLVADFARLMPTVRAALDGRQLQPLLG